jgi:hypothetical protein
MINKFTLNKLISKYYLGGSNESVKWIIKNNTITVDFTTPTRDVIGKVSCDNFKVVDSELAIFDTKKLSNLISICKEDLLIDIEKVNKIPSKLKIADTNYELVYPLADPLLIPKTGTVNEPEWDMDLELESENIDNMIKAQGAIDLDNLIVTTNKNMEEVLVCELIFGDESSHGNKIIYQIKGDVKKDNIKLYFNSNIFKLILQANKDATKSSMKINDQGLMKLEFISEYPSGTILSQYYIIRKATT